MLNSFKDYFISHHETVYENPSPGNKKGGITTLEDKSCGCVQKGGSAPIADVIGYGDAVTAHGLNMLYGPGNDLVSATAIDRRGRAHNPLHDRTRHALRSARADHQNREQQPARREKIGLDRTSTPAPSPTASR